MHFDCNTVASYLEKSMIALLSNKVNESVLNYINSRLHLHFEIQSFEILFIKMYSYGLY